MLKPNPKRHTQHNAQHPLDLIPRVLGILALAEGDSWPWKHLLEVWVWWCVLWNFGTSQEVYSWLHRPTLADSFVFVAITKTRIVYKFNSGTMRGIWSSQPGSLSHLCLLRCSRAALGQERSSRTWREPMRFDSHRCNFSHQYKCEMHKVMQLMSS